MNKEQRLTQRIIRVQGKTVYFTPESGLDIHSGNLPDSARFREDHFFWQVALHSFDKETETLVVGVTDYYPVDSSAFFQQTLKSPIKHIVFDRLAWKFLEPFLSAYRKQDLQTLIEDSEDVYVPDLKEEHFKQTVKVYWKDLTFRKGYVSFRHYLELPGEEIEIQVPNPHLIPEFGFIRAFLSKLLHRKTIDVDLEVRLRGPQIVSVQARSRQIDRIDDETVSTIKFSQIRGLRQKGFVHTIDKSLFTSDEAFDQLEDPFPGNPYRLDVSDIIRTLNEQGLVRNRKQLEYLAGRKQSDKSPIYLTLSPLFGFVFLIEGGSLYHICWELLNSHATYLWSYDKDQPISRIWQHAESIIQYIREHGRDQYRQSYVHHGEDEPMFQMIIHQQGASHLADAFPGWRRRLEEKLR